MTLSNNHDNVSIQSGALSNRPYGSRKSHRFTKFDIKNILSIIYIHVVKVRKIMLFYIKETQIKKV